MTAPHTLLTVDDDPLTCAKVKAYFEGQGYAVHAASNGVEMWQLLEKHPVDVVLLDVGLPGQDGLELARELRARDSGMGLILVSGRNDDVDKIVGLESGADDYVTKPFNSRELLARVKIVMRRLRPTQAPPAAGPRRFGGWVMDIAQRRLTGLQGQQPVLTRGEYDLLAVMARQPGVTMDRERLMQAVFHRPWDPGDRTIDVLIARLREKLDDDPRHPKLIITVRSVGYMLAEGH